MLCDQFNDTWTQEGLTVTYGQHATLSYSHKSHGNATKPRFSHDECIMIYLKTSIFNRRVHYDIS